MVNPNITIKEEANVIHDHMLDIFGNAFNFNHEKGLAEWLKNSIDAYRRAGVPDREQYVVFRFFDGDDKDMAVFECVDFVGMKHEDIQKAFKWWGDPSSLTAYSSPFSVREKYLLPERT